MPQLFTVSFVMDVLADDPQDAARQVLAHLRDDSAVALVFDVAPSRGYVPPRPDVVQIDLADDGEE